MHPSIHRYQFLGTLRENICYPHLDSMDNLTQERLVELLRQVGLEHLLDHESDTTVDDGKPEERFINWSDRLGLGEQQRLAIVRSGCCCWLLRACASRLITTSLAGL